MGRVTACVSHYENTTKFCGCGKSRVYYLAHCCQPTILHCTACCAVQCKLILSLRCVLSGCTVTSQPPCTKLPTVKRSNQCSSGCLRRPEDGYSAAKTCHQCRNVY